KTFWSFLTRQRRSDTFNFTTFVYPQPAMRAGDLSIYSASIRDPLTGQPFAGNQIPQTRISPISDKLMSLYMPLPNRGNATNLSDNHVAQGLRHIDQEDYNFRIDQKIGENNTVSVIFFRLESNDASTFDWNPTDGGTNAIDGAKSIAIEDTHAFGNRMV